MYMYEKVKIQRLLAVSKHAVSLHFYLENEKAYIFNDTPNFFLFYNCISLIEKAHSVEM